MVQVHAISWPPSISKATINEKTIYKKWGIGGPSFRTGFPRERRADLPVPTASSIESHLQIYLQFT